MVFGHQRGASSPAICQQSSEPSELPPVWQREVWSRLFRSAGSESRLMRSCCTQRVLIDAVDAAEVAAAVAEADAGAAAAGDGKPRPLSEKKAAERRHVTLMDWGEWPAALVTVWPRTRPPPARRTLWCPQYVSSITFTLY